MNWWLMALSFVLGLAITLAFQIRRVKREVPVHAAAGAAGAASATGAASVKAEPAKFVAPNGDSGSGAAEGAGAGVATVAAGGVAASKLVGSHDDSVSAHTAEITTEPELAPGPHGPGSATPNEDGSGPDGWTVKGNEDSMLYHSSESPSYAVTRAEVWFRDVETAEKAGFNRWDSGKSQRGLK